MKGDTLKVRGLHVIATIDMDLFKRLHDYCQSQDLRPSRVVNKALSLYLTGKPRPEQESKRTQRAQWRSQYVKRRKAAISVHIDADLVVLAEEYSRQYSISLSTVVNRAIAAFLMPSGLADALIDQAS